jgi:acyl-CoA synthetase (AMP-forming)/AMP-acid ligase II
VEVRVAQDGEILVRGPNVTPGYWRRQEDWRQRFRDGWLYTGDLGRLDDEGYVYIQGRKDDIVNVGGEKFLPTQIEDELATILPDQVYCMIGIPDPEGLLGEIPILAIEGDSSISTKEVRSFLFGRVPEFAIPRRVICFESFPRTDNGKIQRRVMREQAAARADE